MTVTNAVNNFTNITMAVCMLGILYISWLGYQAMRDEMDDSDSLPARR